MRIVAAIAMPKAAPISRNMTVLAFDVAVSAASPRKRPTQIEFTEPFRDCRMLANRMGSEKRIKPRLIEEALRQFFAVRETPGLKKKPTTSELLDWLKLLLSDDISPEMLRERDPRKLIPPLHGALLKNEQDVHLFERLAFLNRRERAT